MKKFILILIMIIVFVVFGVILKTRFNNHEKTPNVVGLANPTYISHMKEGNMKLTTVFANNEKIPSKYTCDGEDLAPELTVTEVPSEAKSLVLIVDDPDAPMGTWVHWVVYNIPTSTVKIDAKNLPKEAKEGITDFGRLGWGGPCPPSGTHRYFFKLYAIDTTLDLAEGATKSQVEKEIKNHIVEKAELIGLYKRGQ